MLDYLVMVLLFYFAVSQACAVRSVENYPAFVAVAGLCLVCGCGLYRNSTFARRCTGILLLLVAVAPALWMRRFAVENDISTLSVIAIALPFFLTGALLIHTSKSKRPRMFRNRQSQTTAN